MGFEFSVMPYPKKEIRVVCKECRQTVRMEPWDSYAEYKRKMSVVKQLKTCPFCAKSTMTKGVEESKIKWERTPHGDYKAIVANGDFLVFKFGNGVMRWRWRFRKKGDTYPERIRVAQTKEEAMKACDHHEEWKV
jgi:hypothetical protein